MLKDNLVVEMDKEIFNNVIAEMNDKDNLVVEMDKEIFNIVIVEMICVY